MKFNIQNYEDLFGVALNDPKQLFGYDGIGSLFGVKDMSGADLNRRGTYAAEVLLLSLMLLNLILIILISCNPKILVSLPYLAVLVYFSNLN